jgi:RNA polymerase sigma-70 factor (ECF subfamily)
MTHSELREQLEKGHVAAFGWALACCKGNRDEAEDVLHDSYLAVLEGKARFDARSSFQTWLFGVIRLTAASARRKAWLRGLILERQNGVHNPEAAVQPDSGLDATSRGEHLRSLLHSLSERQRQVLHLVFYQELSIEEAASAMGVSLGSARTHYARGKTNLEKLLDGDRDL